MFPWNLFPFHNNNKDFQNTFGKMNPEELNQYIHEVMKTAFQNNMSGIMNIDELTRGFSPLQNKNTNETTQSHDSKFNASIFETHDFVYARIPIKNEDWIKQLRIYHTSNQLILEHIPEPGDKQTLTLPAIVRKKGSTARYKEGMLEVKIPKNIDRQFSEIDVTESF